MRHLERGSRRWIWEAFQVRCEQRQRSESAESSRDGESTQRRRDTQERKAGVGMLHLSLKVLDPGRLSQGGSDICNMDEHVLSFTIK